MDPSVDNPEAATGISVQDLRASLRRGDPGAGFLRRRRRGIDLESCTAALAEKVRWEDRRNQGDVIKLRMQRLSGVGPDP